MSGVGAAGGVGWWAASVRRTWRRWRQRALGSERCDAVTLPAGRRMLLQGSLVVPT